MMQCSVSDLSVLERQRLHFDWQEEQPGHHCYDGDLCAQSPNSFACFGNGLPDLAHYSLPVVASNFEEEGVAVSNSNPKRRKTESSPKPKQDESNCKRGKQETESNEEHPKADYIHVRARRGQATDSHSLAERVRRERISQRMKYLQELVPGCSKITGKAGMLDEIINYVQSLQRQVEFLSMKLAAVNPPADNNFSSCSMGISSEPMEQPFLHFNSLQAHPCSGMDVYMDSSSDLMLDSLYGVEFQLGRGTAAFPFQSFQGNLLPNNLKMEI